MSEPTVSDYQLAKWPVLAGEHLLFCTRCGSLISDSAVTAHDRFHANLNRMAQDISDGCPP